MQHNIVSFTSLNDLCIFQSYYLPFFFFLIQAYFAPKWNKTRLMISITLTLLVVYSARGLCEGAALHKSWWWRTFTGVVIQWGAGILCCLIQRGTEFVFVPGPSYCSARKPHCWLTVLMLLACHSPLLSHSQYEIFLFVSWNFRMRP